MLLLLSCFGRVRLCVTPETAVYSAPPSLGFSRQEHWSRLPFPSPMHESEKWKWSHSVVFDSSQPHGLQPTRLLHPWDFPGKSTGVGCHCLLRKSEWLGLNPASLCYELCDFEQVTWLLCASIPLSVESSWTDRVRVEFKLFSSCVTLVHIVGGDP